MQIDTPELQASRWASYGYQDRLANVPSSKAVPESYRRDYDQGYWEADFILRCESSEDLAVPAPQPIDTDSYPYPTCNVDHFANELYVSGIEEPNELEIDGVFLNLDDMSRRVIDMIDTEDAAAYFKELEAIHASNIRNRYILEAAFVMVFAILAGLMLALPLLS